VAEFYIIYLSSLLNTISSAKTLLEFFADNIVIELIPTLKYGLKLSKSFPTIIICPLSLPI